MAIQTKTTVLSVKAEVTEGTPVAPASATDFIAAQDDLTMAPEPNVLENAELKPSLGKSKPIIGTVKGTASFSHYLRHSGVEGQAPNYSALLKAAFGAQDTEATEYNTVSSSTTSLIKVDTGEGAQFRRGQALLIKDGTNGYSIRPVHSISNDDLTIGFNLASAPASGVNLGKAVTFYPADSGHQTLTAWGYMGNGGAVQMVAGARVTEVGIEASAGELINASYTLEGSSYYFNPITIASADRYLDFTDDNGTFAAAVTAKVYETPHHLAEALQTAMLAADPLETFTVTYSNTTGKFTIATSTSALLTLKWNTGANTANTIGDKIGFSVAADDSSATSYTSDNAISFAAPYTPSYDSADPLAAKSHSVLVGDATDNSCFQASSISISLGTPRSDIASICADSGVSGSIVNERTCTISLTALLNQYDADKIKRLLSGTETRFAYIFGEKSGGNWAAGKSGCFYAPTCTVTSYSLTDADGLIALELELQTYVNSTGDGEVYLSFV